MFYPQILGTTAYAGADLLARIALPPALLPDLGCYAEDQVDRLRQFGEYYILELEVDFEREGNPLFAMEAYLQCFSWGVDPPEWVERHFIEGFEAALNNEDHPKGQTEAEMIGNALGFGKGKGETGWFARARQYRRDKEIFFRIKEWLAEQSALHPMRQPKLTGAYAEIAAEFGVNPSTVQRAYRQFTAYAGEEVVEG